MLKKAKYLICLFVLLFSFNFILPSKSEAWVYNAKGWIEEQRGDWCDDKEEALKHYYNAEACYKYENNSEAKKRVQNKIFKLNGYGFFEKAIYKTYDFFSD